MQTINKYINWHFNFDIYWNYLALLRRFLQFIMQVDVAMAVNLDDVK